MSDDVAKQFAQPRIAVRVVAALQHPVDSIIEITPRRFQVSGLEIGLSGSKLFLNAGDQIVDSARCRREQRDPRTGQHVRHWQCVYFGRGWCGRFRRSIDGRLARHMSLHGFLAALIAAAQQCYQQDGGSSSSNREPSPGVLAHSPMVCTTSDRGQCLERYTRGSSRTPRPHGCSTRGPPPVKNRLDRSASEDNIKPYG